MKKILILYGCYGGGHLSAAKSIKQYYNEHHPDISVDMIDFMEYINKTLNKITTKAYSDMAKNARWMWGKVYYSAEKGAFSKINTSAQKILSLKLYDLIDNISPDLIISTHPFSSHMSAILKKKRKISCKIATILTDYAVHSQWLMYPAFIDYFFVAHNGMKEDLLKRHIKESQIKVTGIPLSDRFLNTYDKKNILSELNLDENKKTILFFAGRRARLWKR